MSLYADDMILYKENPKDSTQKLPQLVNEFSKVAGHKINIQKSVAFLYTNNEISERECEKTMPLNFLGGVVVKNPPANTGDMGSSPGLGGSHMSWSN